ncbi:hypothetical protein R20233_02365 [Ralstonia sp. LMG 32965]|uniref:hypothetical protein n=1 Tax=Ralstonia flatus TaxID=3058601 RepID=UPI0028F53E8C|nr:hypothetical protein [Ralstonia sp. LMG 32965]CAJ0877862.1 hypothetical protein R20233_02365 [Ralstonia sp. LMG 32965]
MNHTLRGGSLAIRLARLEAARRAESARYDTGADPKQKLHDILTMEMRRHLSKEAQSSLANSLGWLSLGNLRDVAQYSRLARLVLKGMGEVIADSSDDELLWDHLSKAGRVRTLADVQH